MDSNRAGFLREANDDDLYSHLMYPSVFADFAKVLRDHGDVSVLPTPAFFYGLKPGEEISVSIEEGKVLPRHAEIPVQGLEAYVQAMIELGDLPGPTADVARYVDLSVVQAAQQ